MSSDKSYVDPVKQKSREKLRDFIALQLLPIKRARDIRVVCFPGAEREGEEALEVKEVYDSLGIPRENIVGLEYHRKTAERLRNASLGIDVVCDDAHNFFLRTDKKFDVISLDYKGQMTLKEALTLETIASKHILDNRGVLHTVYFSGHENRFLQRLLKYRHSRAILDSYQLRKGKIFRTEDVEKVGEDVMGDLDLAQSRSDGISYEIMSIFRGGSINYPLGKHLFSDDVGLRSLLEDSKKPEEIEKHKKYMAKLGAAKSSINDRETNISKAYYRVRNEDSISAISSMGITAWDSLRLLFLMNARVTGPYVPRSCERYEYLSNSKSPMLVDMVSFNPARFKLLQRVSELLTYNPEGKEVFLKGVNCSGAIVARASQVGVEKWLKEADDLAKEVEAFEQFRMPPRVDLGSSYVPPKRKESISREGAVELLRAGCSSAEIAECYSIKLERLAALKAHLSRGTYDKKNVSA
ncbi:MAG: hypothetical protein AABW73_04640 [Nanoarchaeota archaeon]